MSTAEAIYSDAVRSLPPEERLRLASLILQDLPKRETDSETETVIPYSSLVNTAPLVKLQSPRLVDAQDAVRLRKQVVGIQSVQDARL